MIRVTPLLLRPTPIRFRQGRRPQRRSSRPRRRVMFPTRCALGSCGLKGHLHDIRKVWVRVHLEDGRMIVGWPDYYSGESGQREVFLKNAAFMDQNGNEYPVDGPGVLVTLHGKITLAEMLNSRKEVVNVEGERFPDAT